MSGTLTDLHVDQDDVGGDLCFDYLDQTAETSYKTIVHHEFRDNVRVSRLKKPNSGVVSSDAQDLEL